MGGIVASLQNGTLGVVKLGGMLLLSVLFTKVPIHVNSQLLYFSAGSFTVFHGPLPLN